MKTNKKIHKLGLILIGLLITSSTISFSTYREKDVTIKDIKTEFKGLNAADEKRKAKDIKIKNDGITYQDTFIPKTNNSGFRVLTVRLTVYWAKGGGTDSDSARKRSSTGYTLRQGDSIAVDPRIIPYEKEVIIPNVGLVKAVDTGTAVKLKTASNGKLPVIDVFFEHKNDAERFANNYPKIVKVAVLN